MPRKRIARPGGPSAADPWSPAAFDAEYAQHRQHARDRLQWRRLQAAKRATRTRARLASLAPDIRFLVEAQITQARARRTATRERLLHGFRWPGGHVNGQAFEPFISRRLRSALHPILRLFVARTPRAGRGLCSGIDKALLRGPLHAGKLLHLDQPYVSFTAAMRGVIRIDLDRTFASWEALQEAIGTAGLPLPNLDHGDDPGEILTQGSRHRVRRPVRLDLIIFHTAVGMTNALDAVAADGRRDAISREALAGLSPYQTEHLNRFGDYILDLGQPPAPVPSRSRRGHSRRARRPCLPRQSL